MDEPVIRQAGPPDEAVVLDVITLAFGGDPMARWSVPDPARYLALMPRFARAFGGNGFAHGSVDLADGGSGAAMWLPPGVEPDSETLVGLVEQNTPPELLPDVMAVFERMGSFHPEEPHWYLPLIGVDPARQGRGVGSALMRHALKRADAAAVPAYLESSNPRNVPFYQRHGFEVLGRIQIGSSPELVPMLRRPGATAR